MSRMTHGAPLPLALLGSSTCEDTAIVRSRLDVLGVPFADVDIDEDVVAAERVRALNGGDRVTPTLVFGDAALVAAEPTLERLGELLGDAGYAVSAAEATQYHGDVTSRAIPLRHLPSVDGGEVSLERYRGRRQVALFLAHSAACLPCEGYARQLARRGEDFGETDSVVVAIVRDSIESGRAWRRHVSSEVAILADIDGAWSRSVVAHVGEPDRAVGLVLLDRFLAPRAGSFGDEAGGLVDPTSAVEWLRYVALECPECSGELPWPESPARP